MGFEDIGLVAWLNLQVAQYIWKKNKITTLFKHNLNFECKIQNNNILIESTKETKEPIMIQVSVEYTLSNTKKVIVLLRNNSSLDMPVTSIDTTRHQNNVNIPAYLHGEKLIIRSEVYPPDKKESLSLKSCQVLEVISKDYKYFRPKVTVDKLFNGAYNLSDSNWVKGISRESAAFFVANTSSNTKKYQIGSTVKFITNETRIIHRITRSSKYINIYFSGGSLDGKQVGYPHEIKVIKGE